MGRKSAGHWLKQGQTRKRQRLNERMLFRQMRRRGYRNYSKSSVRPLCPQDMMNAHTHCYDTLLTATSTDSNEFVYVHGYRNSYCYHLPTIILLPRPLPLAWRCRCRPSWISTS
jgi:hypothetical protein